MSKYAVVTCSDTHMLPAACCALLSIARHAHSDPVVYYLVGIDLNAADLEGVQSFSKRNGIDIAVVPYTASENLRSTEGRWSQATLARLFIDRLLPADLDRVLYIDADVLAVSSVDALWSLDLNGAILGAVEDYVMAFPEKARRREVRLGLKHGPSYFNAGVLLFSWQQCLKDGVFASSRDVLARRDVQLDANDQDVLNIVFQGRWMQLHHGWNVQTGLLPFVTRRSIVHFTGRRKPWQDSRNWQHRLFSQFYATSLDQTPWQGFIGKRRVTSEIRDFLLNLGARIEGLPSRDRVGNYFGRSADATIVDRGSSRH